MAINQYESKKAVIEAISEQDTISPNMPVDVALQEAEDLYVWCQTDKDQLVKAALDWDLVNDLPIRTGACRYIQSEWRKEFNSQEDAQKEWKQKSSAAYDLRNELLHHFSHAFYKQSDLYNRTKKIAEGNTHADMIQDLSDLAALGQANTKPLQAINMDLSLLDKAEKMSGQMAALLAKSNSKKMEYNKLRLLRDKAYTHLKEAVDEIRRCGKYVSWKDRQRVKGYTSRYFRRRRNTKETSKTN